MRPLAIPLLLAAIAPAACARPPSTAPAASSERAADSSKLRVKFRSAFATPPVDMREREAANWQAAMEAERTIVERLRKAGYDVVEHGPWDVRMALTVRVHRDDHADATAVFYDPKDRVVDRITLATEPKRVAHQVVDGVRDSKKLTSYADSRKAKRAQ